MKLEFLFLEQIPSILACPLRKGIDQESWALSWLGMDFSHLPHHHHGRHFGWSLQDKDASFKCNICPFKTSKLQSLGAEPRVSPSAELCHAEKTGSHVLCDTNCHRATRVSEPDSRQMSQGPGGLQRPGISASPLRGQAAASHLTATDSSLDFPASSVVLRP